MPVPRSAAGAGLLGLVLLGLGAYAAFAHGATSVENEARLQIALAAVALVVLAATLFSARLRLTAPPAALAGLAALAAFAAWTGLSVDWSLAPDLSWAALNRWLAYALVVALALVLGASLPRAPERTALGFLLLAGAIALYALGGKLAPWVEIPGLLDLDHTRDFSRLRAPLGYWNALGLVCVLAVPLAVCAAADEQRSRRARSRALVVLMLLLVTLGLTYSRGGILTALLALGVVVALGPQRLKLALFALLGIAAAVPAYVVAVVRDDLTTDGLDAAARSDDGLILLVALVLGGLAAVRRARRLMAREQRLLLGESGRRLARRGGAAAAAATVVLGLGALALSERGVTGTLEREWDNFTAVKFDEQSDPGRVLRSNSGNRWVWWEEAAGAFADEPLTGHGAGSFPVLHKRYRDNDLEVRQPHSVPLQLLAETGLVGALLALGGLGLLGWAAASGLRRAAGSERRYGGALAAAAIAWGAHVWFDWDADIPAVTLPLLAFLGVLAARPPDGATQRAPGAAPVSALEPPPRAPLAPRAVALALGALLLAAVAVSAYVPWLADQRSTDASLLSVLDDQHALAGAAQLADEAIQLNPLAVEPVLTAVTIAETRGRLQEVSDLLEEAVERQPANPDVWERVFLVQQFTGDLPARRAALRRLLEVDPHNEAARTGAPVPEPSSSASATGTPLLATLTPPPGPAIGPPAPGAPSLIGPPRTSSSGGTTVPPELELDDQTGSDDAEP